MINIVIEIIVNIKICKKIFFIKLFKNISIIVFILNYINVKFGVNIFVILNKIVIINYINFILFIFFLYEL